MATNHVQRQSIPPQAFFDQQIVLIHGPVQETDSHWQTLRQRLYDHPVKTAFAFALVLFGLGFWWAAWGYPGEAILSAWGCEAAAAILSALTIFLFFNFRRAARERVRRAEAKLERFTEINALLCTPPPLPVSVRREEEFALTIEYWGSAEALRLTEESLAQAELPDEFLAPDALVLNFEIRETVSSAH